MSIDSYAALFAKYARNTNGKREIAQAILDYVADLPTRHGAAPSILDVGSGDGQVAIKIAASGRDIVCIEPDETLFSDLVSLKVPRLSAHNCTLENYKADSKFDIIILSYIIDCVSPDNLGEFISACRNLRSANGKILVATYVPGSPWDYFSWHVSRGLDRTRRGGLCKVLENLSAHSAYLSSIKIFDTFVSGRNIDDLYENMEFYFRSKLDIYRERQNDFSSLLQDLATTRGSKRNLLIYEGLFELRGL